VQGAIAHPDGTKGHHIVDGSGTLVTGGTIVRSTAAGGHGSAGATIDGGVSRHVAKGDVILIPAGTAALVQGSQRHDYVPGSAVRLGKTVER
jgi:hypothetical protein